MYSLILSDGYHPIQALTKLMGCGVYKLKPLAPTHHLFVCVGGGSVCVIERVGLCVVCVCE